MTKQFKVGDKVRILDVNKIDYGSEHWENGDIACVTKIEALGGEDKVHLSRNKTKYTAHVPFLHQRELRYIEKVDVVPLNPTKNQRIKALEQAQASLESEVATLTRRIEALEQGKSYTHMAKPLTPNQQASANSLRKAIIDEAKAFVAKVTANMNDDDFDAKEGNKVYKHFNTKPEFHVNSRKRTVTALVKGAYNPKLYEKGIAKCAPDDVFNAHIGKAIALGRALGLDVSKFEQAVKPTEVVVGHVIGTHFDSDTYTIKRVDNVKAYTRLDGPLHFRRTQIDGKRAFITDDTEAQYE